MKLQFCPYCGTKLDEGARFCKKCGESMTPKQQASETNTFQESPKTDTRQSKTDPIKEDPRTKRKTVYDGELHKCPNCGELLKSFTTVCPTCAYELRGVQNNSPVEALAKKIEMAATLNDKIELITNFYIPNTKEDIYDFFILAVSNLEDKWYDTDDAWRAKLEQAYHKARLSFGNTPEFEYLDKLYNKTRKEVIKRERGVAAIFRRNKTACITALLIGGGVLMLIVGIILFSASSPEENFGTSWGGLMFAVIGINFIIAPTWVLEEMRKKERKGNKNRTSSNSSIRTVGKDHDDFYNENYDDMAEYLKARGFRNVISKPIRKGLLDTEGAIEGISVAGNTEFDGDDEFDIDSTIIIRYYSRKR